MKPYHKDVLVAETEAAGLRSWVRAAPGQRFREGDLVVASREGALAARAGAYPAGKLIGFAVRGREPELRARAKRRVAAREDDLYTPWRTWAHLRCPSYLSLGLDLGSEAQDRPGMELDGGDYRAASEQLWATREELVDA